MATVVTSEPCGRCLELAGPRGVRCPTCRAAMLPLPAGPVATYFPAPLGRRLLAAAVDLGLILVGIALLAVAMSAVVPSDPDAELTGVQSAISGLFVACVVIGPFAYFPAFERAGGQTPGKRVAGVRVVNVDGSHRVGPRRVAARAVARLLSAASLGVGLLWAGRDPLGRAWHDRLSETLVIPADSRVVVLAPLPGRPGPAAPPAAAAPTPPPPPVPTPPAHAEPAAAPATPVVDAAEADGLLGVAEALEPRHHLAEAALVRDAALRARAAEHGPAVEHQAWLLVHAGYAASALPILNRLAARPDHSPVVDALRAHAMQQAGATEDALALADDVLAADPDQVEARLARGSSRARASTVGRGRGELRHGPTTGCPRRARRARPRLLGTSPGT